MSASLRDFSHQLTVRVNKSNLTVALEADYAVAPPTQFTIFKSWLRRDLQPFNPAQARHKTQCNTL
ncbi:hypothetical protein [Deefgea piscis]|uniref:hypothetical protein n=1 Tax=Deefgea piscis TaxID=2739061 RepID=UPI001C7EEAC6|nr:hypothetical protein [Deefgea piscis]QZA80420.1 hypothetical protein K4H25_12925 [Deefgea piscis]